MGEHQYEPSKVPRAAETSTAAAASKAVTQRIAANPHEDFGDLIVDETAFRNIRIFNQDPDLAFLEARIEGSDAFQIASKPSHINPSSNTFDPTAAIRVAYSSRSRKVDRGVLVATLRWRDGSTETVRISLKGAAHRSNELTHEDEQGQNAATEQREREAAENARQDEEEEKRIREEEAEGGSYQRPITDASDRLSIELESLFDKQHVGVMQASDLVATYKRRPPPPPPPDVVKELALLALDMAAGGILTLVTGGIAGAGWTKGQRVGGGLRRKRQSTPGSKELDVSPADSVTSFLVGKVLGKGTAAIRAAAAEKAQEEGRGDSAAQNRGEQIEFFAMQGEIVADKKRATKLNAIELRRSLIHFDNPKHAGKAAAVLDHAAAAIRAQRDTARRLQAEESMKGWIRHVSHSSMGSVTAAEGKKNGLKKAEDGAATAHIAEAHSSHAYDGVLELEFSADANRAADPVNVSSARLFGVAGPVADSLGLASKPLKTARLPIRARSTASSSPVSVSIARDEAGNVRFHDESGAPGMPSPWLSRRGGHAGSESAAQRAAKTLIEEVAGKTLPQLGVTLETDGSND